VARDEEHFGAAVALGATYTNIGTVPGSTKWNVLLNVTNRLTKAVKFRAYVADTSWTSGEPTGGTLKFAITVDEIINPGDPPRQISGIIMEATEELVVYCDTASALDVSAQGIAIT
jgi:hypothetical protein